MASDSVSSEPVTGPVGNSLEEGVATGSVGHFEGAARGVEREELEARVPKLLRRVAGYNLDMADSDAFNPASLFVGSEGTLGLFSRVKLQLSPLPSARVLGVVHRHDHRKSRSSAVP